MFHEPVCLSIQHWWENSEAHMTLSENSAFSLHISSTFCKNIKAKIKAIAQSTKICFTKQIHCTLHLCNWLTWKKTVTFNFKRNSQCTCTHFGGYKSVFTSKNKWDIWWTTITVPYVIICYYGNVTFQHFQQHYDSTAINGIVTLRSCGHPGIEIAHVITTFFLISSNPILQKPNYNLEKRINVFSILFLHLWQVSTLAPVM